MSGTCLTLNRIEVSIKVLQLYIFAMLLVMLNYMACKLLTDRGAWDAPPINRIEVTVPESQSVTPCTGINLYSNKYPCQVVLDMSICYGLRSLGAR